MLKTDVALTETQLEGFAERWKVACGDYPQRLRGMEVRVVMRTIKRLKRRVCWGQPEANAFWLAKANQLWLALFLRELGENSHLSLEWARGGEIPNFAYPSYHWDIRHQHVVLVLDRQRASIPAGEIEDTAWPYLDMLPAGINLANEEDSLDA
jgi:hypothetical protein